MPRDDQDDTDLYIERLNQRAEDAKEKEVKIKEFAPRYGPTKPAK